MRQKSKRETQKRNGNKFHRCYRIRSGLYKGMYQDIMAGIVIGSIYVWLFFKTISFYILVIPFLAVYVSRMKKKREREEKERLAVEFKDVLQSVSGAVFVGYSVERAILQAAEEIKQLYGKESLLYPELVRIEHKMSIQQTAEQCFVELGERTQVEEIEMFAQMFVTAKRTGGDIQKVIHITGESIQDRLEWKRELRILVGEKKMEKNVMNIIPLCLVAYMRFTSPDIMQSMYQGNGRIIMGICLLVYIGFYIMGERILWKAMEGK